MKIEKVKSKYQDGEYENIMSYEQAMAYMDKAGQYGSVLGLENITELMRRLGNPEERLKFVHIAGTNGKGSVGAYITAILAKAGYLVGRYVSPVLFEYRERIQFMGIDGNVFYISEEKVAEHLSKIKNVIEQMVKEGKPHPTPFEIETAMAFLEFADQKCDIVVLEVGMGGRLDSTNVVKKVECAVLTSISMDHMKFLGSTLGEIAFEKAGIIKKNSLVVSSSQKEEVKKAIEKKVREENARVVFASYDDIKEMEYSLNGTTFVYKSPRMEKEERITTSLLGEYQPFNAVTAIETILSLKEIGYQIEWRHIVSGIESAVWRGRFEIIHKNPIVIIDGAHNEGASLSLRKSMEFYFKGKKVYAVVGIFADKDYSTILKNTLGCVDKVYAIQPNNVRALVSSELAEEARNYCSSVVDAKTAKQAMNLALKEAGKDDIIIVYGSLSYLYEVVEYFQTREKENER
ncbi:bifunctional folylpolyglutamate synthase/dihydrofolate synthase [Velocimicrobium porci]|uniref:tetrahydrofolate synthase n=1 Tax=Velocimicrobium porci TaxID=2606634 RepID=A0A6L5Y053_9FIRM|nr:folylpolyglutamate synthase/dihydrofolate synthase family protein [Velocimicrobium porci]MSS64435.1 bifunctional folylpolyglutamate synthase/dihydrofolate synthase [Velocimicrobium porci]